MDWKLEDPSESLPMRQSNACVESDLIMRVGIPHTGGKLAFNAFNRGYPVMVSASAFWNGRKREFRIPPATDLDECDVALDSAGYTAMALWQAKGVQAGLAGVFPWTCAQYVQLAMDLRPSFWSQPDACCEPGIARNQDEIDFRIDLTATMLEATLRQVYKSQNELAKAGCSDRMIRNLLRPCVPVIQGWSASDYQRSLDLMQQVWQRWSPWLSPPTLIGVGSVCRRDLHHKDHGLLAILARLEPYLPGKSALHLFGIKGAALERVRLFDYVRSVDSMAYDYSARVKAHQGGISNTLKHRAAEMDRWMATAAERARAKTGDQFRLKW